MSHSQQAELRKAPPVTHPEIEAYVLRVLRERQGGGGVEITRESRFHEIGDSLDRVEAMMEMEEDFDLRIADADAEAFQKVGDVIDYLAAEMARRAAPAVSPPAPADSITSRDDDAAAPGS